MTIERKPTRYAHSDGHTDVCYSEDGKKLVTCGTDGDIRIWLGLNDDDPVQTCVGEWSLCVCQKGDRIHIATDNNTVQLMTFPTAERDGILVKFNAPVNHMAIGKEHNFIAIASENMEVKVIDLLKPNEPSSTLSFEGLTGPPLSVALCPKAKLLAVSSGDGHLRIWDVESSSLLKEINCVEKTNSFMNATLLCRISFEPVTGRSLAYPNKNAVVIVNTSDWSSKLILSCPEVEAPFSIVQFSPCGNLMAATSQQGDLVVWEIATQNLIDVTKHSRSIALCAMVWNPSGNGEIAFCDVQGQLGIVVNCVNQPAVDVPTQSSVDETKPVDFDGFQFEDDDDDDENVVSLEKLKNEIMGKVEPELDFDKESSRSVTPRPRTPEIPLQAVFMPTSTPKHLNPRYLCWNDVGIIRSYGSDTDDNIDGGKSIEVEFHDATFHNSMMMQNFLEYTMGSLSTAALIVANASQITAIPLSAGAKEWSLSLPDEEEEIICIASSDNLVCFATNNYLIRLCSIYGTQKAVVSVPGPLVSMSAHGHFLLVAYHTGAHRKGDQCINLMLIKSEGMSIENKDINSALRPETLLQWLGFTDLGTPAMQDSSGLVCLYPISSNIWLPFCETSKFQKNPADGFFVTAVFESLQTVRGIRCRGSLYPSFTPRPTLSELPIEPLFVELATEKSQLEANLFTWSALRVENVEKRIKETALKTFALACKNNLDQRALELIEMMSNPQLVTLATKYATKLNRRRLAEKLVELGSSMQEGDWDDSTFSESVTPVPAPTAVRPLNKRFTLNSSSKRTPKNKTSNEQTSEIVAEIHHSKEAKRQTDDAVNGAEADNSVYQVVSLPDISVNTQESLFSQAEPKNPFLKSLKKLDQTAYNPLSLTDKFAGIDSEEEKKKENGENKIVTNVNKEKRKKPDFDTVDKQRDNKQSRMEKFMFKKRS